MSNILYIVVPCYNEQEVLPETSKRLREKVQTLRQSGKIDADSRILFVNDGSKDATWEMIQKLHEENSVFSGVNLSRNRGHQNALLAGIAVAAEHADMIVSMDADLQDDVDAMDRMIVPMKREMILSMACVLPDRRTRSLSATRRSCFTGCFISWGRRSCTITRITGC